MGNAGFISFKVSITKTCASPCYRFLQRFSHDSQVSEKFSSGRVSLGSIIMLLKPLKV